jgi:hypothetical protein
MEVRDNGPGLPDDSLEIYASEKYVDGNGLKTISRFSDSLFIDRPGGCLIILKTLEGGDTVCRSN